MITFVVATLAIVQALTVCRLRGCVYGPASTVLPTHVTGDHQPRGGQYKRLLHAMQACIRARRRQEILDSPAKVIRG
jgi:hypothetical protein